MYTMRTVRRLTAECRQTQRRAAYLNDTEIFSIIDKLIERAAEDEPLTISDKLDLRRQMFDFCCERRH